ncbi:MAG: peptidase [Microbacterium sp.]|nr:MAG: peptidase [Microbacterium sp.]
MTKRFRSTSVLLILGGGVLALIASTQTWLDAVLSDTVAEPLAVAGATAVPLLAPLSLAALALSLALTIVGPVLRHAFGVIAIAIGVALTASAWRIAAERPIDAVASAVTEATGLTGAETVAALVSQITATPWPALTVAASLLVAAGGALTLATAHRWPGSGRRFRTESAVENRAQGSRPHDAIDSWDDLTRGDDPTN